MPRFNRSARLVFIGTALLTAALSAQLFKAREAAAQSASSPCTGKYVDEQTPTEACGADTHCDTDCTQWFTPAGADVNRCATPDPAVPTANCVSSTTQSQCGSGGMCEAKVGGGCKDGEGTYKFVSACGDGGACYIP